MLILVPLTLKTKQLYVIAGLIDSVCIWNSFNAWHTIRQIRLVRDECDWAESIDLSIIALSVSTSSLNIHILWLFNEKLHHSSLFCESFFSLLSTQFFLCELCDQSPMWAVSLVETFPLRDSNQFYSSANFYIWYNHDEGLHNPLYFFCELFSSVIRSTNMDV